MVWIHEIDPELVLNRVSSDLPQANRARSNPRYDDRRVLDQEEIAGLLWNGLIHDERIAHIPGCIKASILVPLPIKKDRFQMGNIASS